MGVVGTDELDILWWDGLGNIVAVEIVLGLFWWTVEYWQLSVDIW